MKKMYLMKLFGLSFKCRRRKHLYRYERPRLLCYKLFLTVFHIVYYSLYAWCAYIAHQRNTFNVRSYSCSVLRQISIRYAHRNAQYFRIYLRWMKCALRFNIQMSTSYCFFLLKQSFILFSFFPIRFCFCFFLSMLRIETVCVEQTSIYLCMLTSLFIKISSFEDNFIASQICQCVYGVWNVFWFWCQVRHIH